MVTTKKTETKTGSILADKPAKLREFIGLIEDNKKLVGGGRALECMGRALTALETAYRELSQAVVEDM